ncbi:TonB-dependent receptor domain-containing protein [Sphingomicrobium lutaoense]|uniref:Iron complex outermembrane receptor protein n=1 Tax=Sphingomicrobium lutaoense TaxID=515949 RepID=A0A839YTU8_9SPHN|nr:TonB-dependent receptor [Sphingomicrobium lutaoense]MBB3763691.1 iron complex outermembrane receptor protein [Sphingomicrobium lutaoense]
MRRTHVKALAGSSLAAVSLALFTTPAFAQDTTEDCAVYTDEQEKQACLERVDEEEPLAQQGEAATIEEDLVPAQAVSEDAIVITGSRIRRDNFTSPDPIQIVSPEVSMQEGDVETAEILQQSPLAAGSTQITSALSTNFVTDGGPGAQTLSLRGLGANRTLVLVNGRRAGPAGTRGAVSAFDLNVIPSAAIGSVEILKTGASSIYGSDAIAGVVNLITNKEFDGLDLRAFTSLTDEGGGDTYNVSALYGKTFDRGHFQVGGDYFKRTELERGDRDFFRCGEDYLFRPDGVTRADQLDPRTGLPTCGNTFGPVIRVFDYPWFFGQPSVFQDPRSADIQYNDPGDRFDEFLPEIQGGGLPRGFYEVNYGGIPTSNQDEITQYYSEGLINDKSVNTYDVSRIPRTERYTLYADAAYELTDNIEIFVEGLYNRRENVAQQERQLFFNQFSRDASTSVFVVCVLFGVDCDPAGGGDPVNSIGGDYRLLPVIPFVYDSSTTVDYYRGVVGLRGDFAGSGGWLENAYYEGYYQYSRSDGDYARDIIWQDAIDLVQWRQEACNGRTTSYRGAPCVDIDFSDPRVLNGNFTPEEEAFLFGSTVGNTIYRQDTFEAIFGNQILQLPAGPLSAAVGFQWRRDEITDTPSQEVQDGQSFASTSAGVTAGFTRSTELFGEIDIPLIYNTPGIQSLTFNAAGRLTNNYAERQDGVTDSDKGNWTYKLGANWEVNDWLRFRATYGTSYRAPALFEQFLASQTGFSFVADPCVDWGQELANGNISQQLADRCAADNVSPNFQGASSSAEISSEGGIGVLESETSDAFTVSAIFTPQAWFWDGFRMSLAVDYVDIAVKGQIAQIGPNNIISQCYFAEPNQFPTPECSLFTREPDGLNPGFAGGIDFVRDPYLNINKQANESIDFTGRFSQDLGDMGRLSMLAQMTWQLDDEFTLFDGFTTSTNGESGDPKWVGDFNLTWNKDKVTILYGLDVIGGTSDLQDLLDARGTICPESVALGGPVCPVYELDEQFYHSLSGTVDINDRFQFTLGMSNIFNNKPPKVSTAFSPIASFGQTALLGSYYDILGRRVFANVRARF